MESIYDPQLVLNYTFAFNPHTSEESAKASLSKVSGENNIPEVFEVLPNYPNPFNSTTHIRYQLPEKGKVILQIYNVVGQRVKTLKNGSQEAGIYTITWDGTNDFGTNVSSGIYFYRVVYEITGDLKQKIHKLLLIK